MTERKPEGLSWQSWIDRQIRAGQVDGAFDDLDGHGRPLADIGIVRDELWWVRAKLRAEDLEFLPPTIAIRAERARALDAAMDAPTVVDARSIVEKVNARIRYINSYGAGGPPSTAVAIDVEGFLARWSAVHPAVPDDEEQGDDPGGDAGETASWWRRLVSRLRATATPG